MNMTIVVITRNSNSRNSRCGGSCWNSSRRCHRRGQYVVVVVLVVAIVVVVEVGRGSSSPASGRSSEGV